MSKIRVSAVSYANSIPFVQGLVRSEIINDISLSLDVPSVCGEKLLQNKADIGLVPVAVLPELKHYHIISDFCLATEANARTVLLICKVPLEKVEEIILDADSKTSVVLARILAEKFWKIRVKWISANHSFNPDSVKGNTAAVVIGDKAFQVEGKYPVQIDLTGEWKKFTGLPFVFACWVSNKELDIQFISRFNYALMQGVQDIDAAIDAHQDSNDQTDLKKYLTNNISFILDEQKKLGLNLFLRYKGDMKKEKSYPK
jgi:chorismate dehydratase